MYKPRIGVLRGGPSSEYEVSLKTGRTVLQYLPAEQYVPIDIFISRGGEWHMRGLPVAPERALTQCDAVFNALHGKYGEDGVLQRYMDMQNVRYTGSGTLGSGLAMNKLLAKRHLREHVDHKGTVVDVRFAAELVLREGECTEYEIREVFLKLSPPLVVKPVNGGSSVGTAIVRSQDELFYAVLFAFEESDAVLVEQFVRGREVTVAVVEGFRGEELYAAPPVEIRPTKSDWFDYDEKYKGHAQEVCPAPLPADTTRTLLDAARHVHRSLGLRDYSRSDFILARDGVYFLEVNTLPGLTEHSLLPKALDTVGAKLPHFLSHVTDRALAR
jgi:D-alanine-D-alanine ligase